MTRPETMPAAAAAVSAPRAAASGARPAAEGRRVWISWETQRRTLNLSRRLGCELRIFDDEKRGKLRYPLSILKTLKAFFDYRGGLVFVQNPSMILAALACLLKPVFGYFLVVDRHSAYMDTMSTARSRKERLMRRLSVWTLGRADLTIVTNPKLVWKIKLCGGRGFVLPDPYPEMEVVPARGAQDPFEVLMVSTWAPDEPIAEMMEAARLLGPHCKVFISGRPKKHFADLIAKKPDNFQPTGFIPDKDYFDLMRRVDAVAAITKRGGTLVCGGYEAISLGKPVLLGNSRVLKNYFSSGAAYTDSSPADLAEKIGALQREYGEYRRDILQFREKSLAEWESSRNAIEDCIRGLFGGKMGEH